eukprot:gb/GECG01016851.1/.p1 GENE.gb/GECG01016851.1/~~gb/GECG01016851.1/.p1  ORF type:complete len:211 (+),score=23.80 gb/GECG01016851.1/:1-633(+)
MFYRRVTALVIALVVSILSTRSEGLLLHVGSRQRECVLLEAQEQNEIEGSFAVIQTGTRMASNDLADAIAVTAHDPNGATIYSKATGISGEFTTKARSTGVYELCFDNSNGGNEKAIDFALKTGNTHVKAVSGDSGVDSEQVAEEIATLKKRIDEVKEKQSHYKFRTKVAQETDESTNSRVVWYGVFELCVLAVVSVSQLMYIKKLFKHV